MSKRINFNFLTKVRGFMKVAFTKEQSERLASELNNTKQEILSQTVTKDHLQMLLTSDIKSLKCA